MARYIDEQKAKKKLRYIFKIYGVSDVIRNKINDALSNSTADVAEVKHGEWIYHECVSSYDGAISGYSCSVCSAFVNEEVFESDEFHKDFCGHCGAKMDGERRDT